MGQPCSAAVTNKRTLQFILPQLLQQTNTESPEASLGGIEIGFLQPNVKIQKGL